jgi:hypothetical protein
MTEEDLYGFVVLFMIIMAIIMVIVMINFFMNVHHIAQDVKDIKHQLNTK